MFGEIVNALGYPGSLTKVMNSQVAAISAAVLSGIALAAKLQHEREARISAQHSAVTALQRFRENHNAMPVGIFSMKHDGTLIEHNPTFAEMFPGNGRRNSKIGLNWVELTNLEALKAVEADLERPDDGYRTRDRTPDGKRRWFHVRAVRKVERYEGGSRRSPHARRPRGN